MDTLTGSTGTPSSLAQPRFEARQAAGAKTLRPHQSSALQTWEQRGRRGILEHATGSGKTFTAISAMRDALGRREVPLTLVPSELLLDQWHRDTTLTLKLLGIQLQYLLGYGRIRNGGRSRWVSAGAVYFVIVACKTRVHLSWQETNERGIRGLVNERHCKLLHILSAV